MHEIRFTLTDRQLFLLRRIALFMQGYFKSDAEMPQAIRPLADALEKAANPPLKIQVTVEKPALDGEGSGG